ncbi:MAG: hypothetical protein HRU19_02500 [Pseudobacteriovorax sp.]|nr:hypothetical protein [Pseudobacteriovorax sp.]
MELHGKKVSISKKVSIALFLSMVVITILSMLITGSVTTNQFNAKAKQSSLLASRITELSLNQFINKIVSGIDSINNDSDLTRDVLLSLASPKPRRKNFYKYLYRIHEFGQQYKLSQVAIYLKSAKKDLMVYGSMDIEKNHVFSYSTKKPGEKMKELSRDAYGIIGTKDGGLREFDFNFPLQTSDFSQDITLITQDDRLYLSLTYPLINEKLGPDQNDGQFLYKGLVYGYINTIIPMPESFLAQLEEETKFRISFFDNQNNYLLGVNKSISQEDGFESYGSDGENYLNYATPIKLFDKNIATITTSMKKAILVNEITGTLGYILASILGSSIVVLFFLNRKLNSMIVVPIQLLSKTANDIADGALNEWKSLPDQEKSTTHTEIDILNSSFKLMSRQLEQLINEKIKDIESMLTNIEQGIFTITSDYEIHPEYSRYLEKIFGTDQIAGRDYEDFLFEQSNLSSEQKSTISTVILSSISSDMIALKANGQHLLKEITITVNNEIKTLELDWCPIVNDSIVDKIMVTVRDVTELKKLRQESTKKAVELNMIEQLVNVDHNKFIEIYDQSLTLINSCIELADNLQGDAENVRIIFRNLHTAKGLLRTYGLKISSAEIHQIEEDFIDIKENKDSNTCSKKLASFRTSLEQSIDTLHAYNHVNSDVLKRSTKRELLPEASLSEVKKVIDNFLEDADEAEKLFGCVESIMKLGKDSTLKNRFTDLVKGVSKGAEGLGKPPLELVYRGDDFSLQKDNWIIFDGIFAHLIRNSLDHGMETIAEREQLGKSKVGKIEMDVVIDANWLTINICDDGKGLNLDLLREKGELDPEASDALAAALVFAPNFSTAETVTDISGRGVGMDAVRSNLEESGGSIDLEFTGDVKDGFVPFTFVIKYPMKKLDFVSEEQSKKAS